MLVAKRGRMATRIPPTRIAGATAGDRADDVASVAATRTRERRGMSEIWLVRCAS